jgi:hypothetical protein
VIVAKQETVVFYCLEDVERYELELLELATRLALSNPNLTLGDSSKFFAMKELQAKLEKTLNAE